MSKKPIHQIMALTFVAAYVSAAPLEAQDFDSMSKEERKQFLSAYTELEGVDHILAVCEELAPDYADANQAIMVNFKTRRSIG